jgi:hypothetical protein
MAVPVLALKGVALRLPALSASVNLPGGAERERDQQPSPAGLSGLAARLSEPMPPKVAEGAGLGGADMRIGVEERTIAPGPLELLPCAAIPGRGCNALGLPEFARAAWRSGTGETDLGTEGCIPELATKVPNGCTGQALPELAT